MVRVRRKVRYQGRARQRGGRDPDPYFDRIEGIPEGPRLLQKNTQDPPGHGDTPEARERVMELADYMDAEERPDLAVLILSRLLPCLYQRKPTDIAEPQSDPMTWNKRIRVIDLLFEKPWITKQDAATELKLNIADVSRAWGWFVDEQEKMRNRPWEDPDDDDPVEE